MSHGGDIDTRRRQLETALAGVDSIIVAFSGGVDSAYLAWVATEILGSAALCITADSPSYPDHHRQLAIDLARRFHLQHEFVHTHELDARLENRLALRRSRLIGGDQSRRANDPGKDDPRTPGRTPDSRTDSGHWTLDPGR